MDRDQHVTQDAAELYAVYVMQRTVEQLNRATQESSSRLYDEFVSYLADAGINEDWFSGGPYANYKRNADAQLPAFALRIVDHFPDSTFTFENVEKEYRDRGLKGDFVFLGTSLGSPISVSLKNYIGTGGIRRPQVGSGTFASFAQGFVFERVGVGTYLDPRSGGSFRGASKGARDDVLVHLGLQRMIPVFDQLDECQSMVRAEFLGADTEFYDSDRVATAARRVAEKGIQVTIDLFETLGLDRVKEVVLARAGLDGKEEALYFDAERYVDSITNRRYHDLRVALNDDETTLNVRQHGQGIRFDFMRDGVMLLSIHVPYTINTNGAWFRPKEYFEGTREYLDKGHRVQLRWGQRRPYKSKEIATSVNTYVDLQATGIFD